MFEEKYNNLTGAEKENFKRITSLLLNRTFMVNRFYDKNQGTFIKCTNVYQSFYNVRYTNNGISI